ncbi:hypothetical protein MRX96_016931 [Rhipicephalus microplus]
MRRASFPPPVTLHTPPGSPLRRTASSPSFHFLPCSLTGLLQESPRFTPTPPRRCETEANVAGIKKPTVKTGDSLPQLPFQGFTPVYWEWNAWTFSTLTERAKESSTQTEPLTIFSDGAWLKDGQVFGTQDPAKRKHHLEEVTGVNDISSRTVYELDDHIISELLGEYAGFRPKKRIHRSPYMTPTGDFVKQIV